MNTNTIHDLRSFLDALRAAGELSEIHQQVSLQHELGAVLNACERAGKASMFHQVQGHSIPVVGSLLGSPRRIAIALGCDQAGVSPRMAAATEQPIKPVLFADAQSGAGSKTAPCQEVVIRDPDLSHWPIPTHCPLDAGAFITAGIVISRQPGGDQHNLSYNRMQVFDNQTTGISMNIWRHMKAFFDQLEPRGENMPFCVALGCDPVLSMAAAFRYDGDEYEVAGSLRGAPIPLVKAITCDVLVPAWAEIVIEGEVLAGQRRMEGPMGEFTGHYSGSDEKHVARIKAITHRQQPIYQTMTGGGFEHVIVGNMITREPLLEKFIRHQTSKLKAIHLPPYGAGFTALISLKNPNPGEARNVALAAMAAHVNIKTVILLDEDVDVYDAQDVLWALSTRVRWQDAMVPIPGIHGNELDPTSDAHGVMCKTIIDATMPAEERARYRKITQPSVDLSAYLGKPA
jgi:2,5-furandicarboxylate decarboxylase 1